MVRFSGFLGRSGRPARFGVASAFRVARLGWSLCPCCRALASPLVCGSCLSPRPSGGGGLPPVLGGFSSFAFSGSRSCPVASAAAAALLTLLPVGASVSVGCARGVDAVVRAAVPSCSVFSVVGRGAAAFAGRTSSLVSAAVAAGSLLVAFPSGQCAAAVRSSSPFPGAGQGSWGAIALAVQRGGAVLVCSASLPPWLCSQGFAPCGGWWFRPARPVQGSLF